MAADGMHVMMFPFLAFGHISPFVQLARKLVAAGGVRVTLLSAAANVPRVEAMLGPAAGAVAVAPLRLQCVPGLPEGAESTAEVSLSEPLRLDVRRAQAEEASNSSTHPWGSGYLWR